ncbi:MAG: flagellar biosynthetic protein FliO [Lachnospiraceae bacterium]
MLLEADITSIAQFITVFIIFLAVLALTWFVTRWTANFQKGRTCGGNIEVLESVRIAPDKYIQIVRIADKYMAIAIGKESITHLTDLDEDQILIAKEPSGWKMSFEELLEKVREKKDE